MARTWVIGYATKKGLKIVADDGTAVTVGSVPRGTAHFPDPESFEKDFLPQLSSDDLVLTPSGPNFGYLRACAQRCGVRWINPGTLVKEVGKGRNGMVTKDLLRLYEEKPQLFYEHQPTDDGITALRDKAMEWMALERQVTAATNALSQNLRAEREHFQYFPQDEETWVNAFLSRELRLMKALFKKRTSVEMTPEQVEKAIANLRVTGERRYKNFFTNSGSTKSEKKDLESEQKKIIAERLEWFPVDDILSFVEGETKAILLSLPENAVFDGLLSKGTIRTRAFVLAMMRNPCRYPNARAMRAYLGINAINDGQVVQRAHGETSIGLPRARQVFCFDFPSKYWQNDTIGFFKALYYAYKSHQYMVCWDLINLTKDVFKALGRKLKDDDDDDASDDAEDDGEELKGADRIPELLDRLQVLLDNGVPILAGNTQLKRWIEYLRQNPDPKRFWWLFARGNVDFGNKRVERGLNLQMTPKRIEQQVKRMLGCVLADAVYYRLSDQCGFQPPLVEDRVFIDQWRYVTGAQGIPEKYDHTIPLAYYRKKTEELRATRSEPFPNITLFKLMCPAERVAFLKGLSEADQTEVLDGLLEKEREKYAAALATGESVEVSSYVEEAVA